MALNVPETVCWLQLKLASFLLCGGSRWAPEDPVNVWDVVGGWSDPGVQETVKMSQLVVLGHFQSSVEALQG